MVSQELTEQMKGSCITQPLLNSINRMGFTVVSCEIVTCKSIHPHDVYTTKIWAEKSGVVVECFYDEVDIYVYAKRGGRKVKLLLSAACAICQLTYTGFVLA